MKIQHFLNYPGGQRKKRLKKMNRASVKRGAILSSLTHMQLEFQKKPENYLKKYELFLHI